MDIRTQSPFWLTLLLVFILGCQGEIHINTNKKPKVDLPNYEMVEIGTINNRDNTKLYTIDIDGVKYYATYADFSVHPIIGGKVETKTGVEY